MTAAIAADEKCPRCGSRVIHGFGLVGGGFGPYKVCTGENDDECPFFEKKPDAGGSERTP